MRHRPGIGVSLFLTIAGCNQPAVQTANNTSTTSPAPTTSSPPTSAPGPVPGPSGATNGQSETLYRRYASCSATMTAMANFYRSLASQQGGAERADSEQRAAARDTGASAFRDMAIQLAASIGHSPAQVDAALAETEGQIRQASNQMPFEQFAQTLARETDQCVQLGRSAGG